MQNQMNSPSDTPKKTAWYWWLPMRLWRNGSWVLLPIIIFLDYVPSYYEYTTVIPPESSLHRATGALAYTYSGKGGVRIGLKGPDGTVFFTCAERLSLRSLCLSEKEVAALKGQPAEVWWFEHKYYLFSSRKRLVRLNVDGVEKISREHTVRMAKSSADFRIWIDGAYTVFIIVVMIWAEKLERRRQDGKSNK